MSEPFEYHSCINLFEQIRDVLKPGKTALVYTFPFSGHDHRVESFVSSLPPVLRENTQVLSPLPSPTLDESVAWILQSLKSSSLVIIPHAEVLLHADTQYWLKKILRIHQETQTPILWVAEIMPFQLKEIEMSALSHLVSHQYWLPQLTPEETKDFVAYLQAKFSSTTPISINEVYQETGGHTWLTKEIMRQHTRNTSSLKDIINSPAYKAKTELLYQALPLEIKEAAINIAAHKSLDLIQQQVTQQAVALGIFQSQSKLPRYLKRAASQHQLHTFHTQSDQIYLNQVNVSSMFSSAEQKALMLLLTTSDNFVSRSNLAQCFWSNEDYTDWALDRALFRLKKKLTKLGLPADFITTIRGKGYQVRR